MALHFERKFFRSRLGRRIFGLFVLSTLVPLTSLAIFSYFQAVDGIKVEVDRSLRNECDSGVRSLVDFLRQVEVDLDRARMQLRRSLRSGHDLDLEPVARAFEDRLSGFAVFHVESGRRVTSAGEDIAFPSIPQDGWAHLAAGNSLVAQSSRVGELAAVVMVTEFDTGSILVTQVRDQSLWGSIVIDDEFCVLSGDGSLLFSTFPEITPTHDLAMARREHPTSGVFRWTWEEENHRAAYRRIFLRPEFHMEWAIATSTPESRVLEPVREFRRVFLVVSILTLLVSLLLSLGLVRRSLVPIEILRAAADRMADNDFATRVAINSGDELEELGDSFNLMASKVMERTRQLEQANHAKMDFLANMSHELRTPMTAILGYADLCRDEETSGEDRKRYLEIVKRNGKHLLTVINDILDISKIESGSIMVQPGPCDPRMILENVDALFDASARSKGLSWRVTERTPLPSTVQTDETRLQQILINLVGNAIKFTDTGEVALEVSLEEEPGERPVLQFEVRDTGIGMSREEGEAVFEPFVQADGSMARQYGGTGLGLAIARSLARQLGGDIRYEGEKGVGSTFLLTIDPGELADAQSAAEEPAAPTPAAAESVAFDGDVRVLLVEDVAVNRRLISLVLERAGLVVDQAENGAVAYDLATRAFREGEPYAVILMDMQMPVMDGYEATRLLRGDGYDLPIVALTAHSMPEEIERCRAAGCDDFASKPVDGPVLLALVAELHARTRTCDAADAAAG